MRNRNLPGYMVCWDHQGENRWEIMDEQQLYAMLVTGDWFDKNGNQLYEDLHIYKEGPLNNEDIYAKLVSTWGGE